jgi:ABC-type sugar transport system substrate-binding protein
LTPNEIVIIFTKVSTIVTNIAMTATEQLQQETNFNVIKNLIQKGFDAIFIADVVSLPLKKVEEIIKRLKNSSN